MIEVKIVAGSTNPYNDKKLVTYLLKYPRVIHAEFMTHSMIKKNSASSRAIPAKKMIENVTMNPFSPTAFQAAHSGMQGTEYLEDKAKRDCYYSWNQAKHAALGRAHDLNQYGATKQLVNRLLEPFSYIEVLATGTEWENFFQLRCPEYYDDIDSYRSVKDAISDKSRPWLKEHHKLDSNYFRKYNKSQAEIHIQELAEKMWDAYNEFEYAELSTGDWHLPLVTDEDMKSKSYADACFTKRADGKDWGSMAAMITTARAARGSYGKWEGKTVSEDIELHDKLWESGHWSPFEHAARCPGEFEYKEMSDTKFLGFEDVYAPDGSITGEPHIQTGWFSAYHGFMSYRYQLERGLINK